MPHNLFITIRLIWCARSRFIAMLASVLMLAAACSTDEPARIIEVESAAIANATAAVIYITPTIEPSPFPTIDLNTATATATLTPAPTATADASALQAQCGAVIEALYTRASELCLGSPSGYFCNGGAAPSLLPGGNIATSFSVEGALVEADLIDRITVPPLGVNNTGGLVWVHLAESVQMNGLLLGNATITNTATEGTGFQKWQSFTIETQPARTSCTGIPAGSFIVQSPYGANTRLVINGTSIDLNGSLVVQTQANDEGALTHFIIIEGKADITVLGRLYPLLAGQQVDVPYATGDYTYPINIPENVVPLSPQLTAHLPVALMDRPVLLPQPGYALTQGIVNMRAEPDIDAQLLYQVPADSVLSILGASSNRDWYHIRLGNGETGWMSSDLLVKSIGTISTVYDLTPEPPQRLGSLANSATVNVGQGGNLRIGPDTGFGIANTLPQGSEVTLLARSPYSPWVKVDTGGQVGWMALITIETQAAISFLPIDYEAPLPARPTPIPVFDFGGGHAYPDPSGGS